MLKKTLLSLLVSLCMLSPLNAVAAKDNAVTVKVTPVKVGAHSYYVQ